jgi:transcriptional regulator with XRE-family HTH domain
METLEKSRPLLVWTESHRLKQAKSEFADFTARFHSIEVRVPRDFPAKSVLLFYLHDDTEGEKWEKIFALSHARDPQATLIYAPHHSSEWAFHWGRIAEKYRMSNAVWACSFHHLKQLLRANDIEQAKDREGTSFDIVAARNRLGLTQRELANSLGIAVRTLQNWESGVGLGQMAKKVRDLSELFAMMDEFVLAPQETEWLKTPLSALRNRAPIDLVKEGKLRDLIVEFDRLREGQPV